MSYRTGPRYSVLALIALAAIALVMIVAYVVRDSSGADTREQLSQELNDCRQELALARGETAPAGLSDIEIAAGGDGRPHGLGVVVQMPSGTPQRERDRVGRGDAAAVAQRLDGGLDGGGGRNVQRRGQARDA